MGTREFRNDLVASIYGHMYFRVQDNFDFARFNYDGVDRSSIVPVVENARYFQLVLDNLESFYAASLLFSDAESRNLFTQLMKYRCLGHPHIRIREDMTWSSVKATLDKAASYVTGPSETGVVGMFGPVLHHANVPCGSGELANIDAWSGNVAAYLGRSGLRQYYFRRGNVNIEVENGDWVIDGGACFGDTGVFFARAVGKGGRVFAFEPLPSHAAVVAFNIKQNDLSETMRVVPAGIGASTNGIDVIADQLKGLTGPGFSMIGLENQVPTLSIDDFVRREQLARVDFVKLDIEGFELSALKGAEGMLSEFRPKLAISLYHKPEDFFEIPIYLKTKFPFYELYLDHYTIFQEETVLYGVAGHKR